jgi:hypothetical protein
MKLTGVLLAVFLHYRGVAWFRLLMVEENERRRGKEEEAYGPHRRATY